jgi:hypothetical protein
MPEEMTRDLLEVVEDLERRLPPDDALRCVTNALRECHEHLEEHVLMGAARKPPITWTRFIALGNVDGRPEPSYGIYPGIVDDADRTEIERVSEILKHRRVAMFLAEDIASLKASGIATAALALFGEDADGAAVLVVCRHPDITLPQATCLLLAAVMSADDAQARKN